MTNFKRSPIFSLYLHIKIIQKYVLNWHVCLLTSVKKRIIIKTTQKLFCHVVWQINNVCFNVRIILVPDYASVDICSSES